MTSNIPTAFFVYRVTGRNSLLCIGLYYSTAQKDKTCLNFFAAMKKRYVVEPFFSDQQLDCAIIN